MHILQEALSDYGKGTHEKDSQDESEPINDDDDVDDDDTPTKVAVRRPRKKVQHKTTNKKPVRTQDCFDTEPLPLQYYETLGAEPFEVDEEYVGFCCRLSLELGKDTTKHYGVATTMANGYFC